MTTAPAPRPPANLAGLRAHPCDPLLLAVRVGARPLVGLAAWVDWRLGGPIARLVRAGRVPTEGPLLLPPWRLLPAGRVLIWRVGAATAADLARAVRELGAGAPGLCPEDFGLTAAEVARAFDGGATLFAPEVPLMGERLVIGPTPKRRLPVRGLVKWLIFLVIVGLVGVRLFLVELVQVRGNTMAPNVLEGDVLLVVRRATPQPGDVVLVQHGDRAVLRRVLAVPGDTVGTAEGVLLRNELPLETRTAGTFAYYEDHAGDAERPRRQQLFVERFEDGRRHAALGDHVGAARPWSIDLPTLEVPSGHLFLLCDNRRTCPLDELAGVVPRAWVRGVVRYLMWYGDARVEPVDGRPPWGAFLRLDSQRPASAAE